MRRRLRVASDDAPKQTSNNEALDFAVDFDLPLKARSVLGAKSGVHPVAPRIRTPEPPILAKELLAAVQEASATAGGSGALKSNITQRTMPWSTMPRVDTEPRNTSVSSAGQEGLRRKPSGQSVQLQQFYTEQKPSLESMSQYYYDPARQPLHVSQQTSASAVRDMALHKGAQPVQETTSSTNPRKDKPAKPLKSAMKQPKLQKNPDSAKRSRKLDISSLFPLAKTGSSERLLSPAKYSQTPLAYSDKTPSPSQEYVNTPLRPQTQNGSTQKFRNMPTSSEATPKKSAPRVKIFDPDIYDEAKTRKRRPPKGVKNWFDGFDVSSEEEEPPHANIQQEPVELPAEPATSPVEAATSPIQALPSDFSPWQNGRRDMDLGRLHATPQYASQTSYEKEASWRRTSKPRLRLVDDRTSPTSMPANTRSPIDYKVQAANRSSAYMPRAPIAELDAQRREVPARPQMQRADSVDSEPSYLDPNHRRRGESRLDYVQLDSESVLELSEESEEDHQPTLETIRDSRLINEASATTFQRPTIPPRRVHSKATPPEEPLRKSSSTSRSYGSIPIRLTDSMEIPPMPDLGTMQTPAQSQAALSPRMRHSPSQMSKGKSTPRSVMSKDDLRSTAEETTSSVPTDASHVMAVTEEEMMLLELMRQKRAAMQKDSFAEGYRLALKQEEQQLAKKRTSTRTAALKRLLQHEEERLRLEQGSRRGSNTDSVFSAELREQRKRYSMIRKHSVDRNFKMGRFLAMQQAMVEHGGEGSRGPSLAQMERFLMMKPSLLDAIQGSRPVSGTEIESESMIEPDEDTFDDQYTVEEEDVIDENGVIVHSGGPSPMQRLTEMVRLSPSVSPLTESPPDGPDPPESLISDARTQQTMSTLSPDDATAAAFPIPPLNCTPRDNSQKRRSFLAHSLAEEEPIAPDEPARSDNHTPVHSERCKSQSPRPPPQTQQFLQPFVDRESAASTSPPSTSSTQAHQIPPLAFAPLELPPTVRTASPSLSTSRASPLTPTFTAATLEKPSPAVVMVSGSDTGSSFREGVYTSSPEVDVAQPAPRFSTIGAKRISALAAATAGEKKKRVPPHIDTMTSGGKGAAASRVASVNSMTSASEDVLAAWAELGGGEFIGGARKRW